MKDEKTERQVYESQDNSCCLMTCDSVLSCAILFFAFLDMPLFWQSKFTEIQLY